MDKPRDPASVGFRWFLLLQVANVVVFLASMVIQLRLAQRVESLSLTVRTLQRTLAEHDMSETDDGPEPGFMYDGWFSAGTPPSKQFVKTKQDSGETRADWRARHEAAVAAKMALYPPI